MNIFKKYFYNPYKRNKDLELQLDKKKIEFEALRSKVQTYLGKDATEEQKKGFEIWFMMKYFIWPMYDRKLWEKIPKMSSFNSVEEYMQMESYPSKEEIKNE